MFQKTMVFFSAFLSSGLASAHLQGGGEQTEGRPAATYHCLNENSDAVRLKKMTASHYILKTESSEQEISFLLQAIEGGVIFISESGSKLIILEEFDAVSSIVLDGVSYRCLPPIKGGISSSGGA